MQEPDARLGRLDSSAAAAAISSLGNIQNAINAGISNQLNIMQSQQKRDFDASESQKDRDFKSEQAQKARDFTASENAATREFEGKQKQLDRDNQAAMQQKRIDFEANRDVLATLQAQGGNIAEELYSYKDSKGNTRYSQNIGGANVISFKNKIPISREDIANAADNQAQNAQLIANAQNAQLPMERM